MSDNVVSIFPKMREKDEKKEEHSKTAEQIAFKSVAKVEEDNKANAERMKKDRERANKSVLRSYRIKN